MVTVPVGIDDATQFVTGRFDPTAELIALEGGAWSQAYAFGHGGRDLVIRFGTHRDDYERDRVAHQLLGASLPVPEILEIGDAFGGVYAVAPRAHGEPLELLDADGWQRVVRAVLDLLDALRTADLATTVGYGPWDARANAGFSSNREHVLSVADRGSGAGDRLAGWRRELERRPATADLFARGYARLVGMQSAIPEDRHVAHCDLINRNVLVSGDTISSVLDWGCAVTGDHLYDVAWMGLWQEWHPGLAAIDIVAAQRSDLQARGVDTTDYEARITVAQLHQGLANLAYNVWTGIEEHIRATGDVLAAVIARAWS